MPNRELVLSHNAESFLQVPLQPSDPRNTADGRGLSGKKDLPDVSEVRVTEPDVTEQTAEKVSFWLSRAQTRLAYLATVSCGIQGRPVLLTLPARFHDSSSFLHLGPDFYCR